MTIRQATDKDIPLLTNIIRTSNQDIAERFQLTPQNAPKHPSNCTDAWIESAFEKGITYYAVYRLNGKQKWKSLGSNYSVAKIKLKEIEYKLGIGELDDLKKEKLIPFRQYAEERYLPWMQTRRTHKTYLYAKNSCQNLIKCFGTKSF